MKYLILSLILICGCIDQMPARFKKGEIVHHKLLKGDVHIDYSYHDFGRILYKITYADSMGQLNTTTAFESELEDKPSKGN